MFVSDAAKLFGALGASTLTSEEMTAFETWRDHKVLPAIFATGGYILNPSCISSAMVSDIDRVPLPPEAGLILAGIALDDSPILHSERVARADAELERLWRSDRLAAQGSGDEDPVYNEAFFQQVRELGDHPAVRDLNAYVDAVVLPALFAGRLAIPSTNSAPPADETGALDI